MKVYWPVVDFCFPWFDCGVLCDTAHSSWWCSQLFCLLWV